MKVFKDHLAKILLHDGKLVPQELVELNVYFRRHGPIHFEFKQEDGRIVGVSTNFRYGSIVTAGKNEEELDRNIKDAILTAFEVPSAYAKEAGVVNDKEKKTEYALA